MEQLYDLLVDERLTPVQLTTVQTQMFHECRQGPRESVDEFAQEIRKPFSKAYLRTSREGPEAEVPGTKHVSNQFIVGLKPKLKVKMVGVEGSVDELLLKACIEEVKN